MNLEEAQIQEIKEKQLNSCPSNHKISVVLTGYQDDPVAKATFFNAKCIHVDESGTEHVTDERYRYSQLLEFNERLEQDYGQIRLLRLFPPKKWVGNKEGNFVQQRMEAIQEWLNELVADEETCEDKHVLQFFKLSNAE